MCPETPHAVRSFAGSVHPFRSNATLLIKHGAQLLQCTWQIFKGNFLQIRKNILEYKIVFLPKNFLPIFIIFIVICFKKNEIWNYGTYSNRFDWFKMGYRSRVCLRTVWAVYSLHYMVIICFFRENSNFRICDNLVRTCGCYTSF